MLCKNHRVCGGGLDRASDGEGGFPGSSGEKNPPAKVGDPGLIPGLGRTPGEGNSNPLQYSCLGNPIDRKDWWATAAGSQRIGRDLVAKQQQQTLGKWSSL